jgi:hypothetical protein
MNSGSVRGAVKPKPSLASQGLFFGWLRVRGSHDVQSSSTKDAHQQDEYPDATDSRCLPIKIRPIAYLTEESIPGMFNYLAFFSMIPAMQQSSGAMSLQEEAIFLRAPAWRSAIRPCALAQPPLDRS